MLSAAFEYLQSDELHDDNVIAPIINVYVSLSFAAALKDKALLE